MSNVIFNQYFCEQKDGGGNKFSVYIITRQSLQTFIRVQTSIQYIRKPTCEERLHGVLLQKGVLFKTNIYTHIIYITMLPCKRGIDNEKL